MSHSIRASPSHISKRSLKLNDPATNSRSQASRNAGSLQRRSQGRKPPHFATSDSPKRSSKMHHRTRRISRTRARSVLGSFAIALSLLVSLCSPFMTRRVEAQLPIATPTPQRPGQPPGPDLPNLDVMRRLQSLTPGIPLPSVPVSSPSPPTSKVPPGMVPQCNEDSGCVPIGGGGGDPPPPPPPQNDPNYATQRTQPYNSTGEPGITLGSRNFNWSVPLVSLSGRSGMDLGVSLSYNSLVWTEEGGW